MRFENARIFGPDFRFHRGGFSVENKRFRAVLQDSAEPGTDLGGAYVLPGFIDIHLHGNSGCDFSDGDPRGLRTMAAYLARNGITSFAPASMTLPEAQLERAYLTAAAFRAERPEGCAVLRGINMEGPFFSEKKKGAQNPMYLRNPDFPMLQRLNDAANGLIRLVGVAPELLGALDFIEKAARVCTVSLAHTDADYGQAKAAFHAGARHVTHLFNAMPPLLHRAPGVIGAAAEIPQVCAELICDGMHVHQSAARAAYSMFGAERLCLISDALSCCGMPDGEYMLGGQKIYLEGAVARLADGSGTIAGSANHLFGIFRMALSFGIPAEAAVRMASWNPARVLGVEAEVGSIADGKRADFLVCDGDFMLERVYLAGVPVTRGQICE